MVDPGIQHVAKASNAKVEAGLEPGSFIIDLPFNLGRLLAFYSVNQAHDKSSLQTIDIEFECVELPKAQGISEALADPRFFFSDGLVGTHLAESDGSKALSFLLNSCSFAWQSRNERITGLKVILVRQNAFAMQAEILERRMLECEHVADIQDFYQPGEQLQKYEVVDQNNVNILDALEHAVGAIKIGAEPGRLMRECLDKVEFQLNQRMSFDWLSATSIPRRRLAMVAGRSGLHAVRGVFIAAESLNISMVVLDQPGHWLDDPAMSRYREEFVPCDISVDEGFCTRIVKALRQTGKDFDGIVTFQEELLISVAEVAQQLCLPTSPASAFTKSRSKFATRKLDTTSCQAFRVSNFAALERILKDDKEVLNFPMVVKPDSGWGSEGVRKVRDEEELVQAVRTAGLKHFKDVHGDQVVVETYIDGPEVDANLVLIEGEIAFFEVNDDFPSDADADDNGGMGASFQESANMIPTNLPKGELIVLKCKLLDVINSMGFRTGVFHTEARIVNSKYEFSPKAAFNDLRKKIVIPQDDVDAFVLEVNARPPGMQETVAIAHAYGVDYWVLALLSSIGDYVRMKSLATPFVHGAQYFSDIVFISAPSGGVFNSEDVCQELFIRRPDLKQHVSESFCFLKKGQFVPMPESGKMTWVAYFLVFSRTSRTDALRIAHEICEQVRFEIV